MAAACSPGPAKTSHTATPATHAATAPPVAVPAPSKVITLGGAWRLAGIDGASFDETYGLALYADGTNLWWEPRCAGQEVRYRINGTRFSAEPVPATSAPQTSKAETAPKRPICTIGLPPRLEEVLGILLTADRIARTPENGVLISGRGRSLLLFSQ